MKKHYLIKKANLPEFIHGIGEFGVYFVGYDSALSFSTRYLAENFLQKHVKDLIQHCGKISFEIVEIITLDIGA